MFCILNKEGKVIAKTSYRPDQKDLESRNETVVEGQVQEIEVENDPVDEVTDKEYRAVYDRMFKHFQKELQEEGMEFITMKDYHKRPLKQ